MTTTTPFEADDDPGAPDDENSEDRPSPLAPGELAEDPSDIDPEES